MEAIKFLLSVIFALYCLGFSLLMLLTLPMTAGQWYICGLTILAAVFFAWYAYDKIKSRS
jgi:hypothetical protein